TIMSISLSLIAVFIPLLLMSGIVGRLFREFAITVTLTIVVSAFVSLTLSPTMCALLLRDERHIRHGRLYQASERVFQRTLALYERGLDFVLRHQPQTLMVFVATIALAGALYVIEPKGFFPQEDTSLIKGLTDGPQDVSFSQMKKSVQKIMAVVSRDPDVAASMVFLGGGHPMNNSFTMISLKPRSERKASADQIIRRLRREIAKVPGATLYLQSSQDVNVGGRTSRTQYQYTLQDADINELSAWAPRMVAAMKKLPQLSDVASDQQTNSTQ